MAVTKVDINEEKEKNQLATMFLDLSRSISPNPISSHLISSPCRYCTCEGEANQDEDEDMDGADLEDADDEDEEEGAPGQYSARDMEYCTI